MTESVVDSDVSSDLRLLHGGLQLNNGAVSLSIGLVDVLLLHLCLLNGGLVLIRKVNVAKLEVLY